MNNIADLHLHTIYSDGTFTPKELVEKAISDGIKVISITDHDSVEGIKEAKEYAGDRLQIISGVELSAECDGADIHILGYFFDYECGEFLDKITQFSDFREERARKIIEKLNSVSVNIDFDYVLALSKKGVVGRMHIAQALYEKGYVGKISDAFELYIGDNSPHYVKKYKMTPAEAFSLIKDAGGISVWAHPGCSDLDHLLPEFVKEGVDGIEVFHPRHGAKEIVKYLAFAKKYNLIVTGGTDFHGKYRSSNLGEFGLDENYLKMFCNHVTI